MASRSEQPSLLLLPAPPSPSSQASLNAAYRPSLSAAIAKVQNTEKASTLIIAVASSFLEGHAPRTKALRSWPDLQSLLAGLYSLVAIICAEQDIATDIGSGPGSVDIRIVPVDYDGEKPSDPSSVPAIEPNATSVVDLSSFAYAYHPWNLIMHANSEAGYALQTEFLKHAERKQTILQSQLAVVEGGVSLSVPTGVTAADSTGPSAGYGAVCLGGTFDHLHPGHKLLLAAAALLLRIPVDEGAVPCRFIIGITGDALLKNKKYATYVQSWDERALSVVNFLSTLLDLRKEGWKGVSGAERYERCITRREAGRAVEAELRGGAVRLECVEIQDAFGPTVTDESVEVLVVSGETRAGGKAVNDKREGQGWKALDVYEVDVLSAREMQGEDREAAGTEDFSSKISSTAIRQQRAAAATPS